MDSKVLIVGGGWAGLAAATRLVQNGVRVEIFERASELGGRASSFFDKKSGEWLDNGAHVFIGAYKASLELMEIWNAQSHIDFETGGEIPWIFPGGEIINLDLGDDERKISSVTGIMRFKGMSFVDRVKTIRVAEALSRFSKSDIQDDITLAEYLDRFGIVKGDCGGLWDALALAIINGRTDQVSVLPLARAIREGLLGGGSAARIGLPTRPFKQMYIDPAVKFLKENEVEIHCGCHVKSVEIDKPHKVVGLSLQDRVIRAEKVVLTIPPDQLLKCLPRKYRVQSFFKRLSDFEYSPIAATHFTFDRPVLPVSFAMFPHAITHWIFGRGWSKPDGWANVSTLSSSAPKRAQASVDVIEGQALEDIRDRLPEARTAKVTFVRVVRTARATVLLKPGTDKLRPAANTPVEGLFLAGDYTDTGLPATIESAARSGFAAADCILSEI